MAAGLPLSGLGVVQMIGALERQLVHFVQRKSGTKLRHSRNKFPAGAKTMQDAHRHELHRLTAQQHEEAAEQHELAADAHRTAVKHNEKGDDEGGRWHAERALEYSDRAYKLAQEAHDKSGQIVSLENVHSLQ
jgi:hypothetical protein